MSWSELVRWSAGGVGTMACVATMACAAEADPPIAHGNMVCPVRSGTAVSQIDVFDGDPADQASLAPDDNGRGRNTYSLREIYRGGGYVTVRCHYGTVVRDVKLAPVASCRYSGALAHPALVCR